jgi:GNAT superfamily N-acetyltransferase
MIFTDFNPQDAAQLQSMSRIWIAALGPSLAASANFFHNNTRSTTGLDQTGALLLNQDDPIGFVLASALHNPASAPPLGWIDALAVDPAFQGHGTGSALLAWAEAWLTARGCGRARLGGSLRPFAPGLPVEAGCEPFFTRRGYLRAAVPFEWDVARRLSDYDLTPVHPDGPAELTPLAPGQQADLLMFLEREFPGRWLFEAQEHFREGRPPSDYLLIRTPDGVAGFCQITLEDSQRPIERFYMHGLPRPWGQFGPLGVGRAARGRGYGGFLIDAAARHLRSRGVDGCLIDWTTLLGLYGKFGFKPYRQYVSLLKEL